MTVGLESCPPEIIGSIVRVLDLTDVGNLRLTSRCLRSKATQGHFRSCFWSKRVKFTGPELENLAIVTQRGWLGCEINDLTLVGVVNNTERLEEAVWVNSDDPKKTDLETLQQRQRDYERLLESGELVHILGNVFKNIVANNSTGKLRSLSLEVIVYLSNAKDELAPPAGGPWRPIWQMAAETHRIVFSALMDSNLEIDSLNIFNRAGLQRCSIAGNELSSIDYAAEGLIMPLRSLESLSISVSEPILHVTLDDLLNDDSEYEVTSEDEDQAREEAMMKANDERNFTGLASLIQACRNLKHLDIHHCRVELGHPFANIPNERLFGRVAALDTLPQLEGCGLRGLSLTEDDLLAFLRRLSSSLRRFEMETITMTSGTFGSIFELLTATSTSISTSAGADAADAAPFPNLQYLYLDTLRVGRDLVFFTGVGKLRYPINHWNPAHGGNTLSRQGKEDIKTPIEYHGPTNSAPVGSPFVQQWLQDQRMKYGPP
ncbi:F-box domain protein [Aspergillus udagawae]|uniref:F-box domain-containing protein n=1 Tax=Aspergillus udagawae TaxID=91492 RepID=A0A8E0QK68_9EURO|nr:uncharacterized protein Aud_002657 [Aspergillus udagawae]GIC86289.1 hypothetical protein Aud_002657 [Aspergillus udagawae]